MSDGNYRRARARDFTLTSLGAACLALAALFAAGRIWFRALFVAAATVDPLFMAAGFLALAVVLGILHTIAPAPLSPPE